MDRRPEKIDISLSTELSTAVVTCSKVATLGCCILLVFWRPILAKNREFVTHIHSLLTIFLVVKSP